MSKRILGLDLGTNSIGWAVVDDLGNGRFDLIKRGVHIFPEGVKIEKGNESSKAAERTGYRAARRLKFRRKLRKVNRARKSCGLTVLQNDSQRRAGAAFALRRCGLTVLQNDSQPISNAVMRDSVVD